VKDVIVGLNCITLKLQNETTFAIMVRKFFLYLKILKWKAKINML